MASNFLQAKAIKNNFANFETLLFFDLWIPDSGFLIPVSGFRFPDSGFKVSVSCFGFQFPGFKLTPGFRAAQDRVSS